MTFDFSYDGEPARFFLHLEYNIYNKSMPIGEAYEYAPFVRFNRIYNYSYVYSPASYRLEITTNGILVRSPFGCDKVFRTISEYMNCLRENKCKETISFASMETPKKIGLIFNKNRPKQFHDEEAVDNLIYDLLSNNTYTGGFSHQIKDNKMCGCDLVFWARRSERLDILHEYKFNSDVGYFPNKNTLLKLPEYLHYTDEEFERC